MDPAHAIKAEFISREVEGHASEDGTDIAESVEFTEVVGGE